MNAIVKTANIEHEQAMGGDLMQSLKHRHSPRGIRTCAGCVCMETFCYMRIQPKALATELTRMIAANSGQR